MSDLPKKEDLPKMSDTAYRLESQWHKICAVLIHKYGGKDSVVRINVSDIEAIHAVLGEDPVIVSIDTAEGMQLRLLSRKDGEKLAEEFNVEVHCND